MSGITVAPASSVSTAMKAEVVRELKQNLQMLIFYLSPEVYPALGWKELAQRTFTPEDEAHVYRERLTTVGLWREDSCGVPRTMEQFVDLGDYTTGEYLTMALDVISRMSESGPCRFESFIVVTNEALKKEFYKKVDLALKEFVQKSAQVRGDRIVAWNHAGLDCLALPRKEKL